MGWIWCDRKTLTAERPVKFDLASLSSPLVVPKKIRELKQMLQKAGFIFCTQEELQFQAKMEQMPRHI